MYRVGKEEIEEIARAIETRSLFKVNDGLQESKHVEEKLCELFGTENAIFMTSGHAALTSALIGFGIGPGDEVIVPAYTYIATAMAVVAVGAIPVIAEIDETLTLSPADFERKITKYTKAVIPVHIQGFPCRMDAICEIAKKHNVLVLEDACQADGGTYKGKRLGTYGDAGALSFNFFKVVSCGEGGALLTDNREIHDRALIYHDSSAVAFFGNQLEGITCEPFCGQEFRANELCAAMIRVQLDRMDGILADCRRVRDAMAEAVAGLLPLAPSNDYAGDVASVLALAFPDEKSARAFSAEVTARGLENRLPIDTGKHVYKNWTPIMEKRGAFHPLFDPFRMEANRGLGQDYSADMCPVSLDILSRTVYIVVNPDWQGEKLDEVKATVKACALAVKG